MTVWRGGTPVERITIFAFLSFAAVLALDIPYRRGLPLPMAAATDWLAHLGTTFIWIAALFPRAARVFVMAALAATVLVDLDHVPHVAASVFVGRDAPGARLWLLHTLLAVAVLSVIGWRSPGRRGWLWLGLAFGVATHIFRNAASGEGPPLLAPFSMQHVSISYDVYVAILAGLVLHCLGRSIRPCTDAGPSHR